MISHLLAIFLWKRMETHWGTEASEEETEPPQCGQNSNSDDIAWKFPATGASQWRVEDGAIPPRGAACRLRGLSSVLPGKPVKEALSEPGESSPLWPASPWPLVHVAHFAEVKKPRLRECARRCAALPLRMRRLSTWPWKCAPGAARRSPLAPQVPFPTRYVKVQRSLLTPCGPWDSTQDCLWTRKGPSTQPSRLSYKWGQMKSVPFPGLSTWRRGRFLRPPFPGEETTQHPATPQDLPGLR